MLLDSHFVERFHALHRQRLSGSVVAEGDGFRLEVCLAEGDPVAIDVGRGLEDLFIETCRSYHKIDDAGQAELRAAVSGGAKARDYLISNQLLSEAEADQISQSMVEDHLCRCFRGPCTRIDFVPGRGPEQLSLGHSALRMRIGVETLIKTCDQQVGEIQAVEREIGGWDAVFALSEEENVSGQLSEYEKMVLNFIDGRSTVEQIAELCRDSSLNLARVLRSLSAKKVIRKVGRSANGASGVRPALASAPQDAGGAPAAPARKEMVPYYAPKPESGNRAVVMIGLVTLLVISLGVAILVVQYNRKQEALRRDESEISQLIADGKWNEANETVAKLRQQAGTDITAVRTVDGLGQRVTAALQAERSAIAQLILDEEFAKAKARIANLPEDGGLLAKLRDAEDDARAEANAVANEVRARLAAGDVAGALSAIDAASPRRRLAGEQQLALWRSNAVVVARAADKPLQARLVALARLRQARPDQQMEAELATLDSGLQGQIRELGDRLTALERMAAAGSYAEAQSELAKLHLSDLGAGGEIEAAAARVADAVKKSSDAIAAAVDGGLSALAKGEGIKSLDAARAKVAAAQQAYPQASNRGELESLNNALGACAGSGARTVIDRAEESNTLASQVEPGFPKLATALRARAETLKAVEADARASLEEARRLGREGDWDRAVTELQRILGKPNWQQTAVRGEAEQELEIAKGRAARRVQLRADLEAALRKGDVPTCEAIAREMGLAYLPLAIASLPDGAEVLDQDGKLLGKTPLILNVSADQRVEMKLTIRRAGYEPVVRSGAKAEGGWRIIAELKRAPTLALTLGHPLTARPAVVGDALWLADRGRAVRIASPDAPAQAATRLFDGAAPLVEPVFAPVQDVGGHLLLATRERIALNLDGEGQPQRVALPVATDWAPIAYRSQLVIDRDLLIVAGRDGQLRAREANGRELWVGPAGAAFATAPLQVGDAILCVRRDGRLERIRCEDGRVDASAAVSGAVLSAWGADKSVSGLTQDACWSWDGAAVKTEAVPAPVSDGGPDVLVTTLGKICLRRAQQWVEVGRLDAKQLGTPITGALAWKDHAVVAVGQSLYVLGADQFRLEAGSEILPPLLWRDRLVVASLEGGVWIYGP